MKKNFVKDALLGVAVGDALGVPVEFRSRNELTNNPVIDMRAMGSHRQLAGTWSDDSSLTFCLAEMLCNKYNVQDLANRFINWKTYAYWTAYDKVFDIGIATSAAIHAMASGVPPLLAGGVEEDSNGNGSLMRILPLLFYIKDKPINERFRYINEVSSLTHRHIRSVIACFIYLEYALGIINGLSKYQAYEAMQKQVNSFLSENPICSQPELDKFKRILPGTSDQDNFRNLYELEEDEIHSSGYVLHTLEASIWCVLKTTGYKEAVLKAVNLGNDTDTTAAVAGGLAGLLYGEHTIPVEWMEVLAREKDIDELATRLYRKIY